MLIQLPPNCLPLPTANHSLFQPLPTVNHFLQWLKWTGPKSLLPAIWRGMEPKVNKVILTFSLFVNHYLLIMKLAMEIQNTSSQFRSLSWWNVGDSKTDTSCLRLHSGSLTKEVKCYWRQRDCHAMLSFLFCTPFGFIPSLDELIVPLYYVMKFSGVPPF